MAHSESTDATDAQPPADADTAVVKFYPQVWRNDRAQTGDPLTFEVPVEDATDDDGELLEDNTGASDQLRYHDNAPEKARKWQGPFYVVIDAVK